MSAKTFPVTPNNFFFDGDEQILQSIIIHRRMQAQKHPLYDRDALLTTPSNAQEFLKTGSALVSSLVPSSTVNLISYQIPRGYYGVLTDRSCWVTGSSFPEGQNVISWSIAIGDGWLYDHGNLLYSIGPDFSTDIVGQGGVLLLPNQTITFSLNTSADLSSLALADNVMARIKGWLVPLTPVKR